MRYQLVVTVQHHEIDLPFRAKKSLLMILSRFFWAKLGAKSYIRHLIKAYKSDNSAIPKGLIKLYAYQ